MTSMHDTDHSPSKADVNSGSQDFFCQTKRISPRGVVEKMEGAVKYVVPNQ
jgi:hypothetical protein